MVTSRPAARRRLPGPRRGYNLVILMILVTVMNVLIAVAMPSWSQVMKRQREQELIFRGLQYAEAIRVFQVRHGRYPVRLAELMEVEPRSIRQLWTDPLRDDGKWGLILVQTRGGQQISADQLPGSGRRDDDERDEEEEGEDPLLPVEDVSRDAKFGAPEGVQATGPVIGVRSVTEEDTVISFLGSNSTADWEFTADLIPVLPAGAVPESVPRLTSRYIGRPLPQGLQPKSGNLPGSPSDAAGDRRRRRNRSTGNDGP